MGKRRRSRIGSIVEESAIGVALLSADRRVRLVSVGLRNLTEWGENDLIGLRGEYSSDADPKSAQAVANTLAPPADVLTGKHRQVPAFLPSRIGSPFESELHFFPLGPSDEAPTHVLVLVTPIERSRHPERHSMATRLHAELAALRQRLRSRYGVHSLIGSGPAIERVLTQLRLASGSTAAVLILGESGTGREHLARTIHGSADVPLRSFVPIDCPVTPRWEMKQTLSRLIAQTTPVEGVAAALLPRTVYLEDVDHLPGEFQQQLVDAFTADPRPTWRLIVSSTKTLQELRTGSDLLPDFLALVSPVVMELPPLRERTDDLLPLAQHFLERANPWEKTQIDGFEESVIPTLREYHWPGNLRELSEVVSKARTDSDGPLITIDDLPFQFRTGLDAQQVGPAPPEDTITPLAETLERVEREAIREALRLCEGNRTDAAKRLGLTRPTLYRRLDALGIEDDGDRG